MALVSLLFLIAALVLGFVRSVNMGLMAFGLVLILGAIAGMPAAAILAGFPTKLFVQLLGIMLLFSIAQENKTMEQLALRIIAMAGKRTALIPVIVYVFSALLASVGPGTIPVIGLMAVLTCSLAAQMRVSPVLLASTSVLGASAGGLTPIAPTGILGLALAADQGITGIEFPYVMNIIMAMTVYFVVIYVVLGGCKLKPNAAVEMTRTAPFNRAQWITLACIVVLIAAVVVLHYDVGLVSFTLAMVLLLLRAGDQKKAVAGVPWETLLLLAGINTMMSLVISLGGIKLLAGALASLMTPFTAPGVMGLTAGIMCFFSSTSGVVMPTLIPTVSDVVSQVGGVTALSLISAVTNSASSAGMCPISVGGSMGMAAYSQIAKPSPEEQRALFVKLFLVSAGGVIVSALFAMTGAYNLFL